MRLKIMAVFAVLALTTSAHAKDMTGRVGVGADTTLGFSGGNSSITSGLLGISRSSGVSLVYQVSKTFGLQMILSTQLVSSTASGSEASASDLGVALRGIMVLLTKGDLAVQGVGGLGYQTSGADDDQGMEVYSASDLSLEVGVRPEWFVNDNLSFHTQIGIAINILNEDNSSFSDGGTNVNFFGAETLLGSAGFTFYF